MRDPTLRLIPDFRTRHLVVGTRIVRIGILVGLPAPRGLPSQAVADRVVRAGIFRIYCRGADHHVGPVRPEHIALVLAYLVRADEDAVVAALLGHHRQADTGVAARRLNDGSAGLKQTFLFGGIDHPNRNAILDRTTRVQVLDFGQNDGAVLRHDALGDLVQADERRISDQLDNRIHVVHSTTLGGLQ